MQFHDRVTEMEALEDRLASPSSLALVYGQRRVGKTWLLRYLVDRHEDAVYFCADESTGSTLLDRFLAELRAAGQRIRSIDPDPSAPQTGSFRGSRLVSAGAPRRAPPRGSEPRRILPPAPRFRPDPRSSPRPSRGRLPVRAPGPAAAERPHPAEQLRPGDPRAPQLLAGPALLAWRAWDDSGAQSCAGSQDPVKANQVDRVRPGPGPPGDARCARSSTSGSCLRFFPGGGTSAASFSRNSRGSKRNPVVPSARGALRS